jgi:hypothetical protein
MVATRLCGGIRRERKDQFANKLCQINHGARKKRRVIQLKFAVLALESPRGLTTHERAGAKKIEEPRGRVANLRCPKRHVDDRVRPVAGLDDGRLGSSQFQRVTFAAASRAALELRPVRRVLQRGSPLGLCRFLCRLATQPHEGVD